MLRVRAVQSILFEDVAGVRPDAASRGPLHTLRKARRRALGIAIVDWAAIVVLFVLRDFTSPFLVSVATEQGLFTFAVLAVATHAGFRLGQMEKYAAVARAIEELPVAAGQSRDDSGVG